MAPKARVEKRLYYKIGEACKALDIQPYVLRYWETEFPALSPSKSRSGQRVYSEKELGIIRRIKELLYGEGYTIAGAKKKLEAELVSGSLGGPDGEEAGAPEEPEPAEPRSPRAARAARAPEPAAKAAAAPPAALPLEPPAETPPAAASAGPVPEPQELRLDTQAAERIESMRKGILEALEEARDILALLGPKSPPRSSV